jgi:hypothetical protein
MERVGYGNWDFGIISFTASPEFMWSWPKGVGISKSARKNGVRQNGTNTMIVGGVETQKNIELARVEMRCVRFYTEARESALEALAVGDLIKYRALRQDQEYWRGAIIAIALAKIEAANGESANEAHT